MYLFTETKIKYEDDFSRIIKRSDKVKAAGVWVKEKHYSLDSEADTFTFIMKDKNGVEMKVIYKGGIPNNFEISSSVVVTGFYDRDYFKAEKILTKCPSKYQEQMLSDEKL